MPPRRRRLTKKAKKATEKRLKQKAKDLARTVKDQHTDLKNMMRSLREAEADGDVDKAKLIKKQRRALIEFRNENKMKAATAKAEYQQYKQTPVSELDPDVPAEEQATAEDDVPFATQVQSRITTRAGSPVSRGYSPAAVAAQPQTDLERRMRRQQLRELTEENPVQALVFAYGNLDIHSYNNWHDMLSVSPSEVEHSEESQERYSQLEDWRNLANDPPAQRAMQGIVNQLDALIVPAAAGDTVRNIIMMEALGMFQQAFLNMLIRGGDVTPGPGQNWRIIPTIEPRGSAIDAADPSPSPEPQIDEEEEEE